MVTKHDIALAAGVSRTCVSQVLNESVNARISAETRRHVLAVARRMGYRPAPARDTSTRLKALTYLQCYPEGKPLRGNWHASFVTELQRRARQDDRGVMYLATTDYAAAMQETLRIIDLNRPLGVVLDGVVPESMIDAMAERKLPLVIAGSTPYAHDPAWAGRCNTVSFDVADAIGALMRWLHARGARTIALVAHPSNYTLERMVIQAYQHWTRELGMAYNPALIQTCADVEAAAGVVSRYRELGVTYDGMLFESSQMLSPVSLRSQGNDRPRPAVAILGSPDIDGEVYPQAAMAGLSCAQFTEKVYELLSEQIQNPGRGARQVLAPVVFRDAKPG